MDVHARAAVAAVNGVFDTARAKAKELGQKILVSLYSFGGGVEVLFRARPIEEVLNLRDSDFHASGGTPMFDACWRALTDMRTVDNPDTANILTVITDGLDNQSNFQTKDLFVGAMRRVEPRWTMTFSVPNGHVQYVTRFGVSSENVQQWDTTSSKGLEVASSVINNSYAAYLDNRSKGVTRSDNFFTASIDPKQAAAIKRKLDDVQSDFTAFVVTTDAPKTLQDFVESKGKKFFKGSSFYQLTKSETVQANKEVLMKEIKSGAVYGGAQAREILGLPAGKDVKVKPTDHSDWEVFVQSNSNNRKLMPGTTLMYLRK
jgi:fructose-specific component phosphotransferase system IIB-like protein